jgi:hypothetical protein
VYLSLLQQWSDSSVASVLKKGKKKLGGDSDSAICDAADTPPIGATASASSASPFFAAYSPSPTSSADPSPSTEIEWYRYVGIWQFGRLFVATSSQSDHTMLR